MKDFRTTFKAIENALDFFTIEVPVSEIDFDDHKAVFHLPDLVSRQSWKVVKWAYLFPQMGEDMPKILYRVPLTQEERTELESIAKRGEHGSQKVLNALILLGVDEENFKSPKKQLPSL